MTSWRWNGWSDSRVQAGVDGIVPVGTTGESPTVDINEHVHLIALAVKLSAAAN